MASPPSIRPIKTLATLGRRLPSFFFFLMLSLTFLATCGEPGPIRAVKDAPLAEVLRRSGWITPQDDRIPSYLTVEAWLNHAFRSGGEREEADWSLTWVGEEAVVQVQIPLRNDLLVRNFRYSPSTGTVFLIDGDVSFWFQDGNDLALNPASPSLTPHPLRHFLDTGTRHTCVFRWEGCFQNTSHSTLEQVEIRASLISFSGKDQEGVHGVPRKSTPRSGIPAKIEPMAYFCSTLRSAPLPRVQPDEKRTFLGSIEARFVDSGGNERFIVLGTYPLKADLSEDRLAVVSGGDYRGDAKEEVVRLSDPSLVAVRLTPSTRLSARTMSGIQIGLPLENILADYPAQEPPEASDWSSQISGLIGAALAGDEKRLNNFIEYPGGFLDPKEAAAELRRRFRSLASYQDNFWIRVLEISDAPPYRRVTYFVRNVCTRSEAAPGECTLFDVLYQRRTPAGWKFVFHSDLP